MARRIEAASPLSASFKNLTSTFWNIVPPFLPPLPVRPRQGLDDARSRARVDVDPRGIVTHPVETHAQSFLVELANGQRFADDIRRVTEPTRDSGLLDHVAVRVTREVARGGCAAHRGVVPLAPTAG